MIRRAINKGFTIVELLVVIVVIAILATITLVSFNGIQQSARTTVILSSVDAWTKSIQVDALIYTPPFTGATESYWQCLGQSVADFPAKDGFLAGECGVYTDSSDPDVITSYRWDGLYTGGVRQAPAAPATWWSSKMTKTNGLLPVTTLKDGDITLRFRGTVANIYHLSTGVRGAILVYGTQDGKCGRGMLTGSGGVQGTGPASGYCSYQVEL